MVIILFIGKLKRTAWGKLLRLYVKASVILPICFVLHIASSQIFLPYFDKSEIFPISDWYLFSVPFKSEVFYFLQFYKEGEWASVLSKNPTYFWSLQKIGEKLFLNPDYELSHAELILLKTHIPEGSDFRVISSNINFDNFKDTKLLMDSKIVFTSPAQGVQ